MIITLGLFALFAAILILIIYNNKFMSKQFTKQTIKTKEEARQYAIDWQKWQASQKLSYGELHEWQCYFSRLGVKYGLMREFKENGII